MALTAAAMDCEGSSSFEKCAPYYAAIERLASASGAGRGGRAPRRNRSNILVLSSPVL